MSTCYLWNRFILVIPVILLVGYTSKTCACQWQVYKHWP
ncbi:hypothetical protein SLEP1_g22599 [Rubroshorea leprosula]|uniref:Uncharacterized protein n=1 Tax=Rubroshorea leprosula TaxID=152421 RepID=A0AAV5JLP3_9ROSI|nr:hypothetical protein SLEP1_g22599 [Rubroshorea leprosula]